MGALARANILVMQQEHRELALVIADFNAFYAEMGAFISSAGQMGAGVAVRNVEGVLIAACSKQFSSVQSVEMAEFIASCFWS
ncbi:hypothetical protein GH714_032389 [Hevea brasiliensis]|uniref:Uncharacterized protein n=1 Tax=Hevea brasiliensis TaxID=3981 RepID=A0A6A6NLA2_HEVBR|nr:hypothetical protein GH714_032389 [Hevea brasiliensis]